MQKHYICTNISAIAKNMKQNTNQSSKNINQTANQGENISAGMVQYLEIKSRHNDMMLFYRMGDFYELFFEDAVRAASILDIALTKRGTFKNAPIQMCGVPVHSSDAYLERLIAAGEKVAICEQLETAEDAKKRGYKAIMHRDVVRIVTAGTITEAGLLKPTQANYIVIISKVGVEYAVAWADISTGEFGIISVEDNGNNHQRGMAVNGVAAYGINEVLSSYPPSELLIAKSLLANDNLKEILLEYDKVITIIEDNQASSAQLLQRYYNTKCSYNNFTDADMRACGVLCDYISMTQKQFSPRLDVPTKHHYGAVMQIDAATKRNLELHNTLSGQRSGSLLSTLDATVTAAGARLLSLRLSQPIANKEMIEKRLDAVEWGINYDGRGSMRETLRPIPDLERAIGRLHTSQMGGGKGGARDMVAIMQGLQIISFIKTALYQNSFQNNSQNSFLPLELQKIVADIASFDELIEQLQKALALEPPLMIRDGGFIKAAYHPALDEFRELRDESKRVIAKMQADYAEKTNIPSLKVKHNNVLGYFVEIARRFEANVPVSFIHRQTITDCLRYSTVELGEIEHKIINAASKALKLELEIFEELRVMILAQVDAIILSARAIANLDLVLAFAEIAHSRRYTRPKITNNKELQIVAGRHPVVEEMQKYRGQSFIHNDCMLGDLDVLWLITGPNMAGKSTFLRQNALIAIMAHMGCYVPADEATIGVIDKCFSRVGAADDLARGQSTFMVEMLETATILNQATSRSLVILDEIGRGTATYDGMAIAGAVVEHLHNHINCRALFATHYHELTKLAGRLSSLSCYTMLVKEWQGEVKFLHQVGRGIANKSYGVHVAALAGLPPIVIKRAKHLLQEMENYAVNNHHDLPLFANDVSGDASDDMNGEMATSSDVALNEGVAINARIAISENIVLSKNIDLSSGQYQALELLQGLNIDELTPKAALQQLYDLRELLN